jgi:hypothetical protein
VSVLAAGGEMGFFAPSDTSAIEETTGYDSNFSRGATDSGGSSTYNDSAVFADTTDIWVHVEGPYRHGSTTSSSTKSSLLVLLDNGAVEVVRLLGDYSATGTSNWQLQVFSSAAWTNVGAAFSTSPARQIFDIHVVCNSASGSMDVYCAGTRRVASGPVDLSGITEIAQVRCRGANNVGGDHVAYSQIIVADEPTIGWKLGTVVMTGQGTTHTFTTGGFANIDELVYSDADFIQSDTAAQVELFRGTPVPSFTGYVIKAVVVTARAKTSGAGPSKMRLCLRSGGTTYDNGSDITLDFGYGAYCAAWDQNPNGPADWAGTDIASLEYGIKSVT